MSEALELVIAWAAEHPLLYAGLALSVLIALAWLANWLSRHVLLRALRRLLGFLHLDRHPELASLPVASRLVHIVPALVIIHGSKLIVGLPELLVTVIDNAGSAFIIFTIALALGAALNVANEIYRRRPLAYRRPIKGYLEVLKIIIYAIAAILMVASLIDRSPLILLSGLGALAAVLMLIFQDTLLSLVASVQLSTSDLLRVGDWIEMPSLGVDGDVIDIALHTVKVQNFDKTISTVPTRKLISDSFRNWRGMQETGGRRIKRSLYLDQNSIRFLTDEERHRLDRFALLDGYLPAKEAELEEWNRSLPRGERDIVNRRRVTNIGTFRAYAERYLRRHPGVHQGMTLIVRQLAPGANGLPLELYCFTSTVAWVAYEGIQSDIFDHLLAILPEFGLRVFQLPGGADVRLLGGGGQGASQDYAHAVLDPAGQGEALAQES